MNTNKQTKKTNMSKVYATQWEVIERGKGPTVVETNQQKLQKMVRDLEEGEIIYYTGATPHILGKNAMRPICVKQKVK